MEEHLYRNYLRGLKVAVDVKGYPTKYQFNKK